MDILRNFFFVIYFFISAELGAKEMVMVKFKFAAKNVHSFCVISLPLITFPVKKENRLLCRRITSAESDLIRLVIQIQLVTQHLTGMLSFACKLD